MKYEQLSDGEWTAPMRRGFRLQCCRCGLVHVWDFRLIRAGRGKQIQFRVRRVGGTRK